MIALLDVNMLVALMDHKHVLHPRARAWWAPNRGQGWASCPMTQNGFLRIVTLQSYTSRRSIADALSTLTRATADRRHTFWHEDLSILDTTVFDHARLLGPKQVTDVYLLALAVRHRGRFVTLDKGISLAAVRGAQAKHLMLVP